MREKMSETELANHLYHDVTIGSEDGAFKVLWKGYVAYQNGHLLCFNRDETEYGNSVLKRFGDKLYNVSETLVNNFKEEEFPWSTEQVWKTMQKAQRVDKNLTTHEAAILQLSVPKFAEKMGFQLRRLFTTDAVLEILRAKNVADLPVHLQLLCGRYDSANVLLDVGTVRRNSPPMSYEFVEGDIRLVTSDPMFSFFGEIEEALWTCSELTIHAPRIIQDRVDPMRGSINTDKIKYYD